MPPSTRARPDGNPIPSNSEATTEHRENPRRLFDHPDEETDDPSDLNYHPCKIESVRDIENKLHLTREEGELLRVWLKHEMKRADVLGNMTFTQSIEEQDRTTLSELITTAKQELRFLDNTGVAEGKLNALLLARIEINNRNENYNETIRRGKMMARVGDPAVAATDGAPEDEESHPEGHQSAEVDEEANIPSTPRPSVVTEILNNLDIEEQPDATSREDDDTPGPANTPATHTAEAPTFNLDIFHPTAFLIHVVNSITGAAVHPSQLVPRSRRGSVRNIDDMSFETFLENVTQQVGFDVRERVSAVVPKVLGSSLVPTDVTIRLSSEEQWKAVLQLWQNAKRESCEFIVKEG